jgi:hypothetical protein
MKIRYFDVLLFLFLAGIVTSAFGRTNVATLTFQKTVHIGATILNPGTYNVRGDESGNKLEFEKDGKVVAQVQCRWTQLDVKSPADEVIMNNEAVQQVRFEGRTAAAQIE